LHSLQYLSGGVAKLEIEQLESAKLRTSGLRPLPPHPCDLPFLLHGLEKVPGKPPRKLGGRGSSAGRQGFFTERQERSHSYALRPLVFLVFPAMGAGRAGVVVSHPPDVHDHLAYLPIRAVAIRRCHHLLLYVADPFRLRPLTRPLAALRTFPFGEEREQAAEESLRSR
jgi:hypothetical protein